MIILANNRSYRTCQTHLGNLSKQRSRPAENKWIGQQIDNPPPDLAGLARAQGLEAEGPVTELADLPAALARGVEAVNKGGCYVIDVIVKQQPTD